MVEWLSRRSRRASPTPGRPTTRTSGTRDATTPSLVRERPTQITGRSSDQTARGLGASSLKLMHGVILIAAASLQPAVQQTHQDLMWKALEITDAPAEALPRVNPSVTKLPLRYVNEYRDVRGKVRRYFRRPGQKRIPLLGTSGLRRVHGRISGSAGRCREANWRLARSRTKPGDHQRAGSWSISRATPSPRR